MYVSPADVGFMRNSLWGLLSLFQLTGGKVCFLLSSPVGSPLSHLTWIHCLTQRTGRDRHGLSDANHDASCRPKGEPSCPHMPSREPQRQFPVRSCLECTALKFRDRKGFRDCRGLHFKADLTKAK